MSEHVRDFVVGLCDKCPSFKLEDRQARMIRRLRTLADGYRWQRNLTRALRSHDERVAADQERARIVAAMRERAECIRRIVKAMRAVPHPDYRQIEYDQARADGVMSAADAIERGEL